MRNAKIVPVVSEKRIVISLLCFKTATFSFRILLMRLTVTADIAHRLHGIRRCELCGSKNEPRPWQRVDIQFSRPWRTIICY